jgi:hypothetical protein
MLDELNVVRGLRPDIDGPSPATLDQARSALSAEIAGETGRRRNGWRTSRWLVPCFIVAMLGAGGLAAAGLSDWWTDADPPVREAEVASLLTPPDDLPFKPIVADLDRLRTVARAPGAVLVAAPAKYSQKNYCMVRVPDGGQPEWNCFGFGKGTSNEVLMSWAHEFDDATAWYLLGRVTDAGAATITLLEDMTYPLDVEGSRRAPEQPLSTEIGPGGFFLARLPEAMWPSLELGYGSVSVLDSAGATIRRGCFFLGLPPPSPHAGLLGGPHRYDVEASRFEQPCPETGSSVTAATMNLVIPAEDEWSGFAGVELASRERIALESYSGMPVVVTVWGGGYVPTSHRLLDALDTFARRHPEVRVVIVADKRQARAQGIGNLQVAKSRTPSIPILLGEIEWPMMAGKGTFIVALAPGGSAKAELVPSRDEQLNSFPLVSQDLLDELLTTTE